MVVCESGHRGVRIGGDLPPSGGSSVVSTGGRRTQWHRVIAILKRRFFLGHLVKKPLLLGMEADHHLADVLGLLLIHHRLIDRIVLSEKLWVARMSAAN